MGHKHPDNDCIAASVAYAYLKNAIARRDGIDRTYKAVRLGPLPAESAWVIDAYGLEVPEVAAHVHARVGDVMTSDPIGVDHDATLLQAGRLLRQHNLRALVVTEEGRYKGLITTRMIAERYIASTDAIDDVQLSAGMGSDDTAYALAAYDLIHSLHQTVDEVLETDVLTLEKDQLLGEAVEDLMASSLREAVVLDDDGHAIGIVTRTDVATNPHRKVILVDHNETRQAANGIEEAQVLEVIDHHRIGDISTQQPIRFLNLPYGSTSTIVTGEFLAEGIDIPEGIAALLLSAILTDTVIFKSPTTTPIDVERARHLADIIDVDATQFGLDVFRCRGDVADLKVDELVGADAKEFSVGDSVVLIAQRETVDLEGVLAREDEMRAYMRGLVESRGYEFVLLLVTDIIAEGSQFIVEGNPRTVERVFDVTCGRGGVWMPGILSRKKQVAPRILSA